MTQMYGAADILDLFDSVSSYPIGGGIKVMVTQALLTKELAMASMTSVMGLLSMTLVIIDTLCLATSATFLALAWVMLYVIVIETGLALDAKVTMSHEAQEGIAPVIVFCHFDEDHLFVLGQSFKNDLVVVIHREYRDLIIGEMTLKRFDLWSTTRPFGDSSSAMQFRGFLFLNGTTLFKIVVILVSGIPIGICHPRAQGQGGQHSETLALRGGC